jgi:hypothetical protein
MHHRKCKIKIFSLVVFNSVIGLVHGQNNDEVSLHKWYDESVGKENLDFNNGILLLNYDKPLNGVDRFYNPTFQNNTLAYDNQTYNDVTLNYDVANDNVIIKPLGINDRRQIILAKEKIEYFTINNTVYRNINYATTILPSFVNGFYEEKIISSRVILYIKNSKNKSTLFKDDKAYDDFESAKYFVLKYNESYFEINSKKDCVTIFPDLTESIDTFYTNYNYLEKNNSTEFYEKLFLMINANLK